MTDLPFDIVGFDLDGTLLDTHADLGAAVNHALGLIDRQPVPIAKVRDLVGGGSKKMLGRALDLSGGALPEADFKRLHGELLEYYQANIAVHSRLFPGGEAMLDGLAERGVALAVVTNKFERYATRLLDELGLAQRFYTILGGDSLGPGKAKPNPDLLHEMVARGQGDDPARQMRAAFVGDTTFDTGAARAAGMPCVAVNFGFNDLPPEDLGADTVIGHFDDLIPALATLVPRRV